VFKLVLILRYLRRRRITLFPIMGVAIGVMALVTVLSVMKGFDADIARRMRVVTPDLEVSFQGRTEVDTSLETLDEITRRIEAIPEVKAVSPFIYALGFANIEYQYKGRTVHDNVFMSFKGVDFEREKNVTDIASHLRYGDAPIPANSYGTPEGRPIFVVGARVFGKKDPDEPAENDWGFLDRGNRIQLTMVLEDREVTRIVGTVGDVFKTGVRFLDQGQSYMPIDWARAFMRARPSEIRGMGIALKSYSRDNARSAMRQISEILKPLVPNDRYYRFETWEDFCEGAFEIIGVERKVMAVILLFVLVVAAFSITAILMMIVIEKIKDIGVLQAMGASRKAVAATFLGYGVAIGIVGASAGLAAGILFVRNLGVIERVFCGITGWRPVPQGVYEVPAIPWVIDWKINAAVFAVAVVVSLLASVAPAVRAARLDPVEAIRYE